MLASEVTFFPFVLGHLKSQCTELRLRSNNFWLSRILSGKDFLMDELVLSFGFLCCLVNSLHCVERVVLGYVRLFHQVGCVYLSDGCRMLML